jgi:hypothetical protein
MEIAHVEVEGAALRGHGTQIGAGYELRYALEPGWLRTEIVGGPVRELEQDEPWFDLACSPLFNSLPLLHGLDRPTRYGMTFVDVPGLEVSLSEQLYEPLGAGRVRFSAGAFTAEIEFDPDGFVVRYPGLAERVS